MIRVLHVPKQGFGFKKKFSITEKLPKSFDKNTYFFIKCQEIDSKELQDLSKLLSIPIDRLTDFFHPQRRPNVVKYESLIVTTFRAPVVHKKHYSTLSFSMILGKNFLALLTSQDLEFLQDLYSHPENIAKILHKSPVYLLAQIIQDLIDNYFKIVTQISRRVEVLESKTKSGSDRNFLHDVFALKKTVIYLHMALIGNRDALRSLHSLSKNLPQEFLNLLEASNEDLNQLIDGLVIQRELINESLSLYMTLMNNNLNLIMKKLTGLATIVGVPMLITGIYGMNFKHMPELYWRYGYPFSLLLMLLAGFVTYMVFKRKEWV